MDLSAGIFPFKPPVIDSSTLASGDIVFQMDLRDTVP